MEWTIPGTVLKIPREDAKNIETVFSSMFLAGGMVLSQVAGITGLEPYIIHNWVKRGFLSSPQQKKYSKQQLCRICTINMLKAVLPLERICGLLEYVNGDMDKEEDDIIDDALLYFLFVKLAARAKQLDRSETWESTVEAFLADYREPIPGAKERIKKTLQILLTAWIAAQMRQAAEKMLEDL